MAEPQPEIERALEMVRRALAALKRGEIASAQLLLQEATQSLETLQRSQAGQVYWLPPMRQSALGEAGAEIIQALQRADEALSAESAEPAAERFDSLTGLLSRHGFEEHVAELAVSAPAVETRWLLLADLDRLKALNDRYGHLAVDAYLEALGNGMRAVVPAPHVLARLGGEEFGAVIRDVPLAGARSLAERIREAVEELNHPLRATISIGIAGWLPATEPIQDAYRHAEQALYQAKDAGGNRVHVFGIDDDPDIGLAAAPL
jgi:diguanylate cyclase (GGDEF)-like protein